MEKEIKNNTSSIVLKRVLKADRKRVFAAWTDPEIMKKWFYCGEGRANISNELRVGGSYKNEMILDGGCAAPSTDNTHLHFGEYLEILPPEKIVFTWSSAIVKDSRVTVQLFELGDSTEVVITHELLDTELLKEQHSYGWNGCLENLEKYFS